MMRFLISTGLALALAGSTTAARAGAKSDREHDTIEIFHDARADYLEGHEQDVASALRRGAATLRDEARRAAEPARDELFASARELDRLAGRAEANAVATTKELDDAFARAHHR